MTKELNCCGLACPEPVIRCRRMLEEEKPASLRVFVDNTAAVPLETIGPKFENHSRFPDRTNTEFVELVDRGHIKMRVWERGSGETMACGTGACASAVASILAGYTDTKVEVELLGGGLTIEWDREKDTVYMTGPAEEVFSGEIDLKF